jgi:hypothetical protein
VKKRAVSTSPGSSKPGESHERSVTSRSPGSPLLLEHERETRKLEDHRFEVRILFEPAVGTDARGNEAIRRQRQPHGANEKLETKITAGPIRHLCACFTEILQKRVEGLEICQISSEESGRVERNARASTRHGEPERHHVVQPTEFLSAGRGQRD